MRGEKRPDEARAWLEERFDLLGPPDVSISPSLIPWRWLPRSESRIEIVLAGPDFFEVDDEDEEGEEDGEEPDGEGTPLPGEPLLPDEEGEEPGLPTSVAGSPQAAPGG